jgi:hypothetical protein
MEQLSSHWKDFREVLYLSILRKSVIRIQVSLKSDKNNGTSHGDEYTFLPYLAQFFLEWEISQKKCVKKTKTHIVCSITFFFLSKIVYEIKWKHILEPDRPKMTIWRMRFSCWIPKATSTHSDYVILIEFNCNNGCTNTPECYVIRSLPVFYFLLIVTEDISSSEG